MIGIFRLIQFQQALPGLIKLSASPRLERSAPCRVLRHNRQGQSLTRGQARGAFPKIDPRRRSRAFDIAAVRGKVQIGLQQFILAVMAFQLRGADCMVRVEAPMRRLPPR